MVNLEHQLNILKQIELCEVLTQRKRVVAAAVTPIL